MGTWNRCPCRSWRIGSINSSRWLVRFCQPDTIQSNLDFTWSDRIKFAWQVLCPLRCDSAKVGALGLRVDLPQNCCLFCSLAISFEVGRSSYCKLSWVVQLQRILWSSSNDLHSQNCWTLPCNKMLYLLTKSLFHPQWFSDHSIHSYSDDWFSYFVSKNPQSLSLPGRTCELHNASIIDHTILWTAEDGGSPTIGWLYCDHMLFASPSPVWLAAAVRQSIQNCCNML